MKRTEWREFHCRHHHQKDKTFGFYEQKKKQENILLEIQNQWCEFIM